MLRCRTLVLGIVIAQYYGGVYAQQPQPLPIEQFTKYSEFGGIKLSPDGEHAAFLTGKYGRSALVFLALKDKKSTGAVKFPDGFEIYDFNWASNSRVIYELAERFPGRTQPTPTGELVGVNIDGKNQRFIYGYRAGEQQIGSNIKKRESSFASPEIVSPLFANERNILIAEYPWKETAKYWRYDPYAHPTVFLLDHYSGNKKKVEAVPLAGATVMVDREDRPRFAIGVNSEFKSAVSWKPTPDSKWTAFDLPGFVEDSLIPHLVAEDNQSLLISGTEEGQAHNALYRVNLSTKTTSKAFALENADIDYLIKDFAEKNIVGAISYVDKPEVHWINPNDSAAKLYSALQRAFKGQIIRVVSATRDGRLAVVFVSSDVNPGDYYLFDPQTMKADYLASEQRWINPANMRPKEPFTFNARDGLELHGYLTRPASTGPHPMVVLPHGGPHGVRDDWSYDWEVQLLANRGYAVLQVNFRGSDGFGKAFEEQGYKEWGAKMQDDITDATRWAVEKQYATPDRICIYGASYGGYAALMGAVREPTLYRCAIGYAGVYDLELMWSSGDIPVFRGGRDYLKRALGDDRETLRARSPVNNAEKIQIPVLLIHGKEDGRADFDHAKRMKSALEKAGKRFDWMALSREGHGVYDEETRVEVYERILKFLDAHLRQ